MDYMQELKMRLNADYECRIKQWRQDTITVIAAAKLIHDNLEDVVNRQDAKFLLNLNDPMSYIVNQWLAEHGETAFYKDELLYSIQTLLQEHGEVRTSGTVRDFLMEHMGDAFSFMTPCGFVSLTGVQAEKLFNGHDVTAHPGVSGASMDIPAEVLLTQRVQSANLKNGVWYILTEYPEQTQSTPEMEVTMC